MISEQLLNEFVYNLHHDDRENIQVQHKNDPDVFSS
jgi:hypothetical protein